MKYEVNNYNTEKI